MDGVFKDIETKGAFLTFVKKRAENCAPPELTEFFAVQNTVSDERVNLAFTAYTLEIRQFSEYLNSKNPDHYKRSGALLYALCTNPILLESKWEYSSEELEGGLTRFTGFDADHLAKYLKFHETYYNQFVAFDIAYAACCAYETHIKALNFDDIHNICHYLKKNNDLKSDSYFMLFRTLMA